MLKLTDKINVKHATGELPEQEIEVEYNVVESLQEAVKDAGGEPQLVDAYNDARRGRALQNGRNTYRNAAKGSVLAEVIEKVKAAVLDFSFANSQRGMGQKAKAEKVDKILEMLERGEAPTPEQLLQMLKSRA